MNSKALQFVKSSEIYINFILIIIYPILLLTFGINFTDGPWNMRMAQVPDALMPYWLTATISNLWASIFGNSMLSFRLLGYLCKEFIILIFFLFFFKNKNQLQFSRYALIVVVTMFLPNTENFQYDMATTLCLMFIFIGLLKFIITNKLRYLSISGFASILAVLARFPNMVVIPVMFFLLALFPFFKYKETSVSFQKKAILGFKLWMIYGISCFITLGAFFILFMSPYHYFSGVLDTLSGFAQSSKDHSLSRIISGYYKDGLATIKYVVLIFIIWHIYNYTVTYLKLHKWMASIFLFILFYYYLLISNEGYIWHRTYITALICFILGDLIYTFFKQKKRIHLFLILSIAALIFIPSVGSNTGLLRCRPIGSYFTIFFLYWLSKANTKNMLQKNVLIVLLTSIFIFGISHDMIWADSPKIIDLQYSINHAKLKNIKTTIYRKELTEKIITEINRLSPTQKDMLFFGAAGQMFYYLYDKQSLSKQLFYLETDDKNVITQLETLIKKENYHPLIIIIHGYPNNSKWPQYLYDKNNKGTSDSIEKSKDLIKMLAENKYKEIVTDEAFLILN